MTCWRRLHEWQLLGVWDLIHSALLDWLARDDQIDWSRAPLLLGPLGGRPRGFGRHVISL